MAISGHKTRSVFDRYNIVSEEDVKQAAVAVESHLNRTAQDLKSRVTEIEGARGHKMGTIRPT